MNLRYRRRALEDLRSIETYYLARSPDAVGKVLADINTAVGLVMDFPGAGKAVGSRGLRRVLTRRYRYMIAYRARRDLVEVVGIFRYQNCDA